MATIYLVLTISSSITLHELSHLNLINTPWGVGPYNPHSIREEWKPIS